MGDETESMFRKMELLKAAKGLVADDFLEEQARALISGVIEPAPPVWNGTPEQTSIELGNHDEDEKLITAADFVAGKYLPRWCDREAISRGFGRSVHVAYVRKTGREPSRALSKSGNRCYSYPASTQALMERLWEQKYGGVW